MTSFELEYEIEIQKRFRKLQKIFADKKAELARIAQAGFQIVIRWVALVVLGRELRASYHINTLKTYLRPNVLNLSTFLSLHH